jgi:hypothetical protein
MIKLFSFKYQSDIHFGVAESLGREKRPSGFYQITLRDKEFYIIQETGEKHSWKQAGKNGLPAEFVQAIGEGLEESGIVVPKWRIWRHYCVKLILKITS